MTQPVTVKIDLKPFNDSLDALAKGLNKSVNELLPYHAASVWKTAMNRTRSIPTTPQGNYHISPIERAARVRALNDVGLTSKHTRGDTASTTISVGVRRKDSYGKTYLRLKPPGKKPRFVMTHDAGFAKRQFPDKGKFADYVRLAQADVNEYGALLAQRRREAKNTTHFGKQSFLSALQDLQRLFGIDWMQVPPVRVPGLAKILKATDRKGRSHRNGYAAIRVKDPKRLTIEMENHFPSDAAKAAQSINSAIKTVDSRIKRETKVGLFKNLSEVVKRYPFLKIS